MADQDSMDQSEKQEKPQSIGFRRSRRFAISMNMLALIILAAAILGMINYLSIRHYKRMDWTTVGYYSLSDKTTELLKTIKEPVTCIVFFQPRDPIFPDVRSLLKEYQEKTSKLIVEYVDPYRNMSRTEQLLKEYDLDPRELNVVIFVRGEGATKKSKYVKTSEIVEMEGGGGGMFGGPPPTKKAFKGEQAFTSAIQAIFEAKQPTIYFLTGHGERDPDDYDQSGYGTLSTQLKRDNIKTAKLSLATTNQVPADCDVLVVAGPAAPVPPAQQAVLEQYLQNKGRMCVLLDAQKESGLDEFLQRWGVIVDNDLVVGLVSILGLKTELSAEAVCQEYGPHPIAQKMEGFDTTFPMARSLGVDSGPAQPTPDKPRVTWLAKSHEGFWGETDLANLTKIKFDSATDKKGPLTIAAAVESGNLPGTPVEIASTRMVVVGSSGFVANGAIDGANLDFFLNSINWLINKPERVLGISPKTPREFRLSLSEIQTQTLKLSLIFGLPGCVAVIGAIVWWRRRK